MYLYIGCCVFSVFTILKLDTMTGWFASNIMQSMKEGGRSVGERAGGIEFSE